MTQVIATAPIPTGVENEKCRLLLARRNERRLFLGTLAFRPSLLIFIVVFVPVLWLSSLSFLDAGRESNLGKLSAHIPKPVVPKHICRHAPDKRCGRIDLRSAWLPALLLAF